jgi:hypothetical protein
MYVVSSKKREREFISKTEFSAFIPIMGRTHFISYEFLTNWHAKSYEQMLIEREILRNEL